MKLAITAITMKSQNTSAMSDRVRRVAGHVGSVVHRVVARAEREMAVVLNRLAIPDLTLCAAALAGVRVVPNVLAAVGS